MILSKKVEIRISSSNFHHFKERGYIFSKCRDIINVDVNDLMKKSSTLIKVKCDICGKEKELCYSYYLKNIKKYNLYTCSNSCANIKNKLTNKEKYGDENFTNRKKAIETMNKKYGKYFNNREKYKETLLDRYGVESHNQIEFVKEKKKNTFFQKYGVDHYSKTDEYKEKMDYSNLGFNTKKYKETCFKKYGGIPSKNKKIIKKISNTNKKTFLINTLNNFNIDDYEIINIDFEKKEYILKHNNCNKIFNISYSLLKNRKKYDTTICVECNPINKSISGLEILLKDLFKNEKAIFNSKNIINPYELDIYLPDLKLAFEFNGLYWHNEINRNNDYHYKKTELCEEKGIQLIHIFEDDWKLKNDIIKSLIFNKLNKLNRLKSNNLEIKEINDNKVIRNFLNNNHIKGYANSTIKIGLYEKEELLSIIIFKKMTNKNYKLLRFCNKKYINLLNSFNKLFKYFIKKYNPNEIIHYLDRSYFNEKDIENLNFKLVNKIKPDYFYVVDNEKVDKSKFSKKNLIKDGYNLNETEHEIMLKRKIYRIYNSGYLKYKWTNE